MLSSAQVAAKIAKTLDDKKATDIQVLKTTNITILADYFVICTAGSTVHLKTLCDELEKRLEDEGEPPLRREGYRDGGWILIDFGCVVVHLFLSESRDFYALERLWSDAEQIDISELV